MTIRDDKNREVIMGVDVARGESEQFVALIGKDAAHSVILKQTEEGQRAIAEIIQNGMNFGWDVGFVARALKERPPLFPMFPSMQYWGSGNFDNRGQMEVKDKGWKFEQLITAEFPDVSAATLKESAIDYAAAARGRALRRMRNGIISIDGIVVGSVDDIQIEHTYPRPEMWDHRFYPTSYGKGRSVGTLKFHVDEVGLNDYIQSRITNREVRGGFLPATRSTKKMDSKPYEKKNITAIVYRQLSDKELTAIAEGSSFRQGQMLPAATRENDVQMRFIGYVYEGETAEQVVNDDITKNAKIAVDEDRTYLVFDAPGVIEVEGPKSRMTTRRKSGTVTNTESPR